MTRKKIISSFAIALFSALFVGGIFYLSDRRFADDSNHERMFSWGFVVIYFVTMFLGHLFMNQIMQFFENIFRRKNKAK